MGTLSLTKRHVSVGAPLLALWLSLLTISGCKDFDDVKDIGACGNGIVEPGEMCDSIAEESEGCIRDSKQASFFNPLIQCQQACVLSEGSNGCPSDYSCVTAPDSDDSTKVTTRGVCVRASGKFTPFEVTSSDRDFAVADVLDGVQKEIILFDSNSVDVLRGLHFSIEPGALAGNVTFEKRFLSVPLANQVVTAQIERDHKEELLVASDSGLHVFYDDPISKTFIPRTFPFAEFAPAAVGETAQLSVFALDGIGDGKSNPLVERQIQISDSANSFCKVTYGKNECDLSEFRGYLEEPGTARLVDKNGSITSLVPEGFQAQDAVEVVVKAGNVNATVFSFSIFSPFLSSVSKTRTINVTGVAQGSSRVAPVAAIVGTSAFWIFSTFNNDELFFWAAPANGGAATLIAQADIDPANHPGVLCQKPKIVSFNDGDLLALCGRFLINASNNHKPVITMISDRPWSHSVIIDLNGDGRKDFIGNDNSDDDIEIQRSNSLAAPDSFVRDVIDTQDTVKHVVTGDFDGDSRTDLAFVTSGIAIDGLDSSEYTDLFISYSDGSRFEKPNFVYRSYNSAEEGDQRISGIDAAYLGFRIGGAVDATSDLVVTAGRRVFVLQGNASRVLSAPLLNYIGNGETRLLQPVITRAAVGTFLDRMGSDKAIADVFMLHPASILNDKGITEDLYYASSISRATADMDVFPASVDYRVLENEQECFSRENLKAGLTDQLPVPVTLNAGGFSTIVYADADAKACTENCTQQNVFWNEVSTTTFKQEGDTVYGDLTCKKLGITNYKGVPYDVTSAKLSSDARAPMIAVFGDRFDAEKASDFKAVAWDDALTATSGNATFKDIQLPLRVGSEPAKEQTQQGCFGSALGEFGGSVGIDAALVCQDGVYRNVEGDFASLDASTPLLQFPGVQFDANSRMSSGDVDGNGVDDLVIIDATHRVWVLLQDSVQQQEAKQGASQQ